ncbi:MAG: hypothetical protein EHM70_21555 [Chloroflexota bacterium]|nr:MAG: hypothetical protein EHM70_21555 [Chloroflexota bacterium]
MRTNLQWVFRSIICDFGDEVIVLERGGTKYSLQCYPLEGIHYVVVGSILLDAWIKISLLALSIQLPETDRLELVFQTSMRP